MAWLVLSMARMLTALIHRKEGHGVQAAALPTALPGQQDPALFFQSSERPAGDVVPRPTAARILAPRIRQVAIVRTVVLAGDLNQHLHFVAGERCPLRRVDDEVRELKERGPRPPPNPWTLAFGNCAHWVRRSARQPSLAVVRASAHHR